MQEAILEVEGVSKSFPGVKALDRVSFDLRRGEVHALVGENGAGKSTLMKILSGVYQPDEGVVRFKGHEVTFHDSTQSRDAGIGIIYQELNLIPQSPRGHRRRASRRPLTSRQGYRIRDAGAHEQRSGADSMSSSRCFHGRKPLSTTIRILRRRGLSLGVRR